MPTLSKKSKKNADESAKSGITRRNFLKGAAATTGAFGLVGAASMGSVSGWLEVADAEESTDEQVTYCYHQMHCFGGCALKCTTRDGRLVKLEPNDAWTDSRYSTICPKGIAEIQHVYSAERIQTPMKRIGERGSDEFEAISWDEAMQIFKERISAVQEKYGNDAVYFMASADANVELIPSLLKGSRAPFGYGGTDVGQASAFDQAIGNYWCISPTNADDWVNSKTVIILGSNMVETRLVHSIYLMEAKEAGAKIVVVDPRYSPTAGKANQWIPIQPGTDAALILAMISQVIDNEWYDEEFMRANTTFPFLVDVETGKLIQGAEEGAIPIGKTTPLPAPIGLSGMWPEEDPTFLVWDEISQSARYFAEKGIKPALKGTFTYEGRKVRPVFDLLLETQKPYTVSWAAEKTGIDEAIILELAERYATAGPAVLCLAYGAGDKYNNSDVLGHADVILGALTGNFGNRGGGVGGYALTYSWFPLRLGYGYWPIPEEYAVTPLPITTSELPDYETNVHAVVAFGDAVYSGQRYDFIHEYLDTLDFSVIADIYFTPGVRYADLILPVCTKFENESEVGGVKAAVERIMLRNKVLDPLFESKSDFEIERAMAKAFDLDDLMPPNAAEMVKAKLANVVGIDPIPLEKIQQNQGVYEALHFDEPPVGFADQTYCTPTRRIELYMQNFIDVGQALPVFEDLKEASVDSPKRAQYPLQLITPRSRFQIHEQFWDARWLQDVYEPHLAVNPVELEARGLSDGDIVEVFNDRGSFKCKVFAENSMRPGVSQIPENIWPKFLEGGDIKSTVNTDRFARADVAMYSQNNPFYDTLVEIKKV